MTDNGPQEADRFWAQAEAAYQWRQSLSPSERQRMRDRDAVIDTDFDGIA